MISVDLSRRLLDAGLVWSPMPGDRFVVDRPGVGDDVNGPFSAFAQAQIIDKHALDATGGKTYAELAQDDPLRQTAMSASFLRASLFTSVVAFGVATMAMGVGLAMALAGVGLRARPAYARAALDG